MFKELLTAAAGVAAFFGGASSTADHRLPPPHRQEVQQHATSLKAGSFDVSCVAAAVAAREAVLAAGISTNSQAINTAYTDRAAALASAYAQTDQGAVKKAVKSAWDKFGAALRLAHRGWKTAQQNAWSQFRTALKACGAGATTVSDSSNASLDASAGSGSD
jgi:hypothetical protein